MTTPNELTVGTRIRWTPTGATYAYYQPRYGDVVAVSTDEYGVVTLTVETAGGRYLVSTDTADVETL